MELDFVYLFFPFFSSLKTDHPTFEVRKNIFITDNKVEFISNKKHAFIIQYTQRLCL